MGQGRNWSSSSPTAMQSHVCDEKVLRFLCARKKLHIPRQSLPVINSRRIPGIISGVEGPEEAYSLNAPTISVLKSFFPLIMMLQCRGSLCEGMRLSVIKGDLYWEIPTFHGPPVYNIDAQMTSWWTWSSRPTMFDFLSRVALHCCSNDRCHQGGSVAKLFARSFKFYEDI